VWNIASPRAPLWIRTPYKDDVQCIDWSPDGKWISSAGRDGRAFLHNAENGNVVTELHTLLLAYTGSDKYRFRSLKFIPGNITHYYMTHYDVILGDSPENFGIISGHEPRRQTKPPLPCLIHLP